MDHIFRNLLIRYQNYFIEFFQLIEDKDLIKDEQQIAAQKIKNYLENMPELVGDFDISFSISKQSGALTATWSINISDDGFSVRSYSVDDLDEIDEWHFNYYSQTQEYEGNLFTDGDWDLFLDEVAEIDDAGGEKLFCELNFSF